MWVHKYMEMVKILVMQQDIALYIQWQEVESK